MTDHFTEAESYLQKLDTLDPTDAYVAVVAAQAHAQLAQIGPARDMVELQRQLLGSMLPPTPTKAEQVKAAIEEAQALSRAMPGPEEQPKPAVPEPEAFGSIVRAETSDYNRMLWQRSPMHGKHYWESETGAVEVWSELTDVEVLRVGLGEADPEAAEIAQEAFRDGVREGRRAMNVSLHLRLREQLDEAIGAERKNAIERMITVVEELAS